MSSPDEPPVDASDPRWQRDVLGETGAGGEGLINPSAGAGPPPGFGAPPRAVPPPLTPSETVTVSARDARPLMGVAPVTMSRPQGDQVVHGDPVIRRLGRLVLRVAGASRYVHELAELVTAVQSPVTTGRRIVVTGGRDGAGKSTVAALLGLVLAHLRSDRVLAIDADPGVLSLPSRLRVPDATSLSDLSRAGSRISGFEDVRPHLATGPAGLWVLAGHDPEQLSPAAYQAGIGLLGRFFAVTVTDCGADADEEFRHGLLDRAHAQVLVTPATADGTFSARRTLEIQTQQGHGALLERTVVVFVAHAPRVRIDVDQAVRRLPPGVVAAELGYDRHLAAGSEITARLLAEGTYTGATRLAAQALTRALEVP
ncbi:MAG: ATPase involved in chromosome partitioning-like protein [Actinomycetia bacterium]|nr:ATPase involved in chromosome partitioning-like protein [Actinomycetes bacterium]